MFIYNIFQINDVKTFVIMCSKCDEIRCLRDNCPGLGGCRLCGNFSSNIYHERFNFSRPSTPIKFSKVSPKRYQKTWLLASKSVWKSDFLCIALWCVAILSVSQASTDHYHTQISSLPPIPTLPTTNNSSVHFSEGRSKYITLKYLLLFLL